MPMLPGQPMPTPGAVPGAAPVPSAAPPAAGGGGNPLAMLAGAGAAPGGGMPQGMQQFLTFLAGMGFKQFQETMTKLRNPQGSGGHGKSALGKEAQGNPGQTQIPAQMLAQLAARRAQAGAPGAAPGAQPNPLAALMGRG